MQKIYAWKFLFMFLERETLALYTLDCGARSLVSALFSLSGVIDAAMHQQQPFFHPPPPPLTSYLAHLESIKEPKEEEEEEMGAGGGDEAINC